MDFIFPLLVIFGIVAVGGYGFYKHALKHTDGTDDIQTADSGQKGLMSSAHADKVAEIDEIKTDLDVAEAEIIAARGSKASVDARLDIEHNEDGSHKAADHYVDRGDPAAYDFAVGDFTTDGTWNDLDLSGIVPAGAKAVHLFMVLVDDAAGSLLLFRKKGNTSIFNVAGGSTQVVGVDFDCDIIVSCDANRVIGYYGSNLAFTTINLVVKGWWI